MTKKKSTKKHRHEIWRARKRETHNRYFKGIIDLYLELLDAKVINKKELLDTAIGGDIDALGDMMNRVANAHKWNIIEWMAYYLTGYNTLDNEIRHEYETFRKMDLNVFGELGNYARLFEDCRFLEGKGGIGWAVE